MIFPLTEKHFSAPIKNPLSSRGERHGSRLADWLKPARPVAVERLDPAASIRKPNRLARRR